MEASVATFGRRRIDQPDPGLLPYQGEVPTRMSDVNSRQTRSKEATMPNQINNEDGGRDNVSRRNFFKRIGVAGAAAATTGPVPAAAQTPAMATEVSVDDRFHIQDVLRSYVWAN